MVKLCFPDFKYINLEDPSLLERIEADPKGFFLNSKHSWIIDEAQKLPNLPSYIQTWIDAGYPGKFILTGSHQYLLMEKISQSLAGRAMILQLLPLSYRELAQGTEYGELTVWQWLYRGTYPRPYHEHIDIEWWYQSYLQTYLERDVRLITQVQNLGQFVQFIKLCASQHGQQLNLSALATACGISQPTARQWLSILESSYIIFLLQPYHNNLKKRLVKTPKLYFHDSAIVCQLLGIESEKPT